jgi:lipid-binding SYLF domain-containing protein
MDTDEHYRRLSAARFGAAAGIEVAGEVLFLGAGAGEETIELFGGLAEGFEVSLAGGAVGRDVETDGFAVAGDGERAGRFQEDGEILAKLADAYLAGLHV